MGMILFFDWLARIDFEWLTDLADGHEVGGEGADCADYYAILVGKITHQFILIAIGSDELVANT
jgi:hypothetical protein